MSFWPLEANLFYGTLMKKFSSARGDHKKKNPQQEDILEWVKPALPLEEFDDLFFKDLIWAHVVSLHQWLDTLQSEFTAPLVVLLKVFRIRSRLSNLVQRWSLWRGML